MKAIRWNYGDAKELKVRNRIEIEVSFDQLLKIFICILVVNLIYTTM